MEGLELEMEELDDLVGGNRRSSLDEGHCESRRSRIISIALVVVLLVLVVLGKSSRNQGREIGVDGDMDIDAAAVVAVDDTPKESPAATPDTQDEPAATPDTLQDGTAATADAQQEEPEGDEDDGEKEEAPKKKKNMIPPIPLDRDQLPLSEAATDELIDKWGQWHFWDGDEEMRPKEDYCAKYPNRDIPGDDFPDDSWQVDAVYVNHYLNDADKMITRAKEAIFTEYGKGKPLPPEGLFERLKMFHWEKLDMATATSPPPEFAKRGKREIGGWTTKRSIEGLVRRLLHAMITEDTFTMVLAGHSAASGAGNHFRQSYMMQAYRVLRPVFERLGVKLVTRNISQGGLGTIQGAMGSAGIYGDEIDLMIWDSGMTENGAPEHIDLFLRQALIGGNRVPVVWGGHFDLLKMLHEEADVDVGENGWGLAGMPVTENEEQMKSLPWAYQRMNCPDDRQDLCSSDRFRVTCWIDRPDGIKPEIPQLDQPRGQVKWHPGWRTHQLVGRVIAFSVLEALQVAVNTWSDATLTGQPLDEDYWHVTDYYDNIRKKVRNLDPSLGHCYKINGTLPTRMCNTPMQGRTQYTPRAHPEERSISALIKPAPDGYVPRNEKVALYEGPDVHIPDFDVPEGEIDVVAILENRRRRLDQNSADHDEGHVDNVVGRSPLAQTTRRLGDAIIPGKGWQVFDEPQGTCDGTYEAICGRSTDNECLLPGHHDARGAVIGNEYAGWLVLQLKDVKEGIIVVKLHTWHWDKENTRTAGWTSVNNERRLRVGDSGDLLEIIKEENHGPETDESDERVMMRSYTTPESLPDTFTFDYAINGEITSLNKEEFLKQKHQIQRVVETLTLLDDKDFSSGKGKDVEVAIRMRGCGRDCVFGLSHIYWA